MKLVFLPQQTPATREWAARLRTGLNGASIIVAEDAQHAATEIVDADAALGWLPADLLMGAQKLRWLQAPFAAPNTPHPQDYFYPALIAHPVVLSNFREIYNDHVGAHAMMYVLNFARDMHHYYPNQLRREWRKPPDNQGVVVLNEATMLIVGVGGIGGEVARLASAFGIKVIGVDARRQTLTEGLSEIHASDKLDDLLPRADFVVLTTPHTPATEGFFNYARFCRMKPSAFFINVGRGQTVVLNDLTKALVEQKISGAGLDVYDIEPLPADHPLWTTPGAILTPHMGSYGTHLNERRYQVVLENCQRFMRGDSLLNVVDKENWF